MSNLDSSLPPIPPELLRKLTISSVPTSTLTLKQPLLLRWTPQEDITAFELAKLTPYLCGKPLFDETWAQLGTMQRHFERVEEKAVTP